MAPPTDATGRTPEDKREVRLRLGRRIRELRESSGYTQERFAAHAGLDRSYFGAVERGERNVSLDNISVIASALEVEIGELFRPEDQGARD